MNNTQLNETQTIEQECQHILKNLVLPPKRKQPPATRVYDVCVVGGLGHVGLPLGITFAHAGLKTVLYDVNQAAIQQVARGEMPFVEQGAESLLQEHLNRTLFLSDQKNVIAESYFIIIVIGTPVDEHLNPKFNVFKKFIDELLPYLTDNHHLILRSTIYPGLTEKIKSYLESQGKKTRLSFCPERIAQGKAVEELADLPQIISAFDNESLVEARDLFRQVCKKIIELTPREAELAKLFCNTWRYIQFAISNQFYQTAMENDVDFYKIYEAITCDYPRLKGMSRAGFAAGPCLFKDTMQLAAFSNNTFFLGHTAMLINEGLPDFIVRRLKSKYPLNKMNVGILGMAFKANIDDKRESLAYKLKKILEIEAGHLCCTDVYIQEPGFVPVETLIEKSNVIIVATPHREYAGLTISGDKILVDIWNFYGKGGLF